MRPLARRRAADQNASKAQGLQRHQRRLDILPPVPPTSTELARAVSIVGIGETDYGKDYRESREQGAAYDKPTVEQLAALAFDRALADSGLKREDIDGLTVSFMYGGPSPGEAAASFKLQPRLLIENHGIMAGPLPVAAAALQSGACDTIALVYAVATRSQDRSFGGVRYGEGGAPASYYYYHPWGWSSQAAHWAMVWQRYRDQFAVTEADLAEVAVLLRENAMRNPNAIMRKPLTVDDYLASRYVVRPLHLYDLCLVNDGAVCLILRRSEMSRDLQQVPVELSGWGTSKVTANKLRSLVMDRLKPQFQEAGGQALEMAGITLSDIGHFEGYDASTIHLVSHIEGHGFVAPGEGLAFCKNGGMARGGPLPVNTAGGMLSGSYMHGWNHVAEIVRQLRHDAGERQIAGLHHSMFSLAQTDQVDTLLFERKA